MRRRCRKRRLRCDEFACVNRLEDFPLSRSAKLSIFYAADRIASVVAVGSAPFSLPRIHFLRPRKTRVFRITDPAKPWTLCAEAPMLPPKARDWGEKLSPKVRLLPVYTKARAPGSDFEAILGRLEVSHVPGVPFRDLTRGRDECLPGAPRSGEALGLGPAQKRRLSLVAPRSRRCPSPVTLVALLDLFYSRSEA